VGASSVPSFFFSPPPLADSESDMLASPSVKPRTGRLFVRLFDVLPSLNSYKNAQMLFSSARHLPAYSSFLTSSSSSSSTSVSTSTNESLAPIPTIREFQVMIEQAWKAGASRSRSPSLSSCLSDLLAVKKDRALRASNSPRVLSRSPLLSLSPPLAPLTPRTGHDVLGRQHFNGHLVGSRRWIGTTEVYTALTWMGLRCVFLLVFPFLTRFFSPRASRTLARRN
jgi:hypothetical protein